MGSWFSDRLSLNFQAFAWRGIYMTGEGAVVGLKGDLFQGIQLSEQILY